MKNCYYILLACAALAACSKSEMTVAESNSSQSHVLCATAPSEDSKTTIDGYNVKWADGDEIYVVAKDNYPSTGKKYTLKTGAGTSSATFESSDPTVDSNNKYFAAYPYSAAGYKTSAGGYCDVTIPSTQTHDLDDIAYMVGTTNDSGNIVLRHVSSILRLQLYSSSGKQLKSVRISNDNYIAGRWFYGSYPVSGGSVATDAVKYIVFSTDENIKTTSSDPTIIDFHILTANNVTLSNFTILVNYSDGTIFQKTLSSSVTVEKGSIRRFSPLDCVPACNVKVKFAKGDSWQDYDNSTFAIPATCDTVYAKSLSIVDDTDFLSELCDAIKNSSRTINLDLSEATSYNFNCRLLKGNYRIGNIILPSTLTSLSNYFEYSSVGKITIGDNLNDLGDYFQYLVRNCLNAYFEVSSGNPNLKSVNGSLYSKDGTIFYSENCTLTEVIVPTGVTTVYGFLDNQVVTTIELPSTMTAISSYVFGGCKNLNSITSKASSASNKSESYYDMLQQKMYPGYSVTGSKIIQIPSGSLSSYQTNWSFISTINANMPTSWTSGWTFSEVDFSTKASASLNSLGEDKTHESDGGLWE